MTTRDVSTNIALNGTIRITGIGTTMTTVMAKAKATTKVNTAAAIAIETGLALVSVFPGRIASW